MKDYIQIKDEIRAVADSTYNTVLKMQKLAEDFEELANKTKLKEKDLDIKFLAERNLKSGIDCTDERETGQSSDSIVAIAYGTLPPERQILPCDKSDMRACERMWKKLPEHRKTPEVLSAMERARSYMDEK